MLAQHYMSAPAACLDLESMNPARCVVCPPTPSLRRQQQKQRRANQPGPTLPRFRVSPCRAGLPRRYWRLHRMGLAVDWRRRRRSKGRSHQRTHFLRIIRKAGVRSWGRPFHNLRSSRQTELTETFPAHVVAAWLGNTVQIATQHYLQVTEEHFQRAAKSGAARHHSGSQPFARYAGNIGKRRGELRSRGKCRANRLPPAGFEPATFALGKRCSIL